MSGESSREQSTQNLDTAVDSEGRTLEAVRVDDIIQVSAEPLDEAAIKRRLVFKGLGCFAVVIAIVLALSLTLQGGDTNSSAERDMVPMLAPTLAPDLRLQLMREFFIDTFHPLYETEDGDDSGRTKLQSIFDNLDSPQSLALEWLAYQDVEIGKGIRLEFLQEMDLPFRAEGDTNDVAGSRSSSVFSPNGFNITADQVRLTQRYALAVFFWATNGPTQWLDTFEFTMPGHECDWSGVLSCVNEGQNNRVSHINLVENGLQGSIPQELSALLHLQSLVVSFNDLTGMLPSSLAFITGLKVVDVAHNDLSGTIPEQYYTHWLELETLKIGENQFTGSISSLIGSLEQLKHLGAERLYWQGTVPKELFQKLTNLEFLELSNQNIGFVNDTIATEIGLLTNLQSLIYHGTGITGTIPSELGLLTDLGRMQLASNHMTGTIPTELGALTKMTRLAMSVNALTGTLPTEFTQMRKLTRFELQNTFLTGDIGFLCQAIVQLMMD